jgi:hypothetical protein
LIQTHGLDKNLRECGTVVRASAAQGQSNRYATPPLAHARERDWT